MALSEFESNARMCAVYFVCVVAPRCVCVCQKCKHTNCITFVIQATDYSVVISGILLVRHRCRINCAPIRVCGGRPTCTRVYDKNTNWFNLTLLGMRISTLHRLVTWIELKGLMRSNVNSIEVNPRTKHIKLHTQHTDTTQRKTRVCVYLHVCVCGFAAA